MGALYATAMDASNCIARIERVAGRRADPSRPAGSIQSIFQNIARLLFR